VVNAKTRAVGRVVDRRRWPLDPLLAASRLTRTALAREVGTSTQVVTLAGRRGLTDVQAVRWAIRLGLHPILVWGWAWIEAAAVTGPAHHEVAEFLRDRIERGELRPGDTLPTARVLSERWNVSQSAAERAITELRRDGLLTGGRGRRNRVAAPPPPIRTGEDRGRSGAELTCAECGGRLDDGGEHYPHEPDCGGSDTPWCSRDRSVHADCASCALAVTP